MPFFRAASSPASGFSTTAISVNYVASPQAGELLIAHIVISATATPSFTAVPTGWTLILKTDEIAPTPKFSMATYHKYATGSETGSVSWTAAASSNYITTMTAWGSPAAASPIDAAAGGHGNATGTANVNVTAPTATPSATGGRTLRLYGEYMSGGVAPGVVLTLPGGISSRYNSGAGSPTVVSNIGGGDEPAATTFGVAVGTLAAVGHASDPSDLWMWGAQTVVLKPGPPAVADLVGAVGA